MPVDYQRVQDRFSKAASSYYDDAVMQSKMASRLLDLLTQELSTNNTTSTHHPSTGNTESSQVASGPQPPSNTADTVQKSHAAVSHDEGFSVLEIGCGPGNFTSRLLDTLPVNSLCINDLSQQMLEQNILNLSNQGYCLSDKSIISISDSQSDLQLSHTVCSSPSSNFDGPSAVDALPVGAVAVETKGRALEDFRAMCCDARLLSKLKDRVGLEMGVFDLIVSNASFQWFEDLQGAIQGFKELAAQASTTAVQDAHRLSCSSKNRGCYLAFSSFYEGHFAEVKELTDVSLNYLSRDKVIEALEACGLAYKVSFEREAQYFSSSVELFRHLHETGVNAIADTPLSPGSLRRVMREYEERYSDEHGVRLTWHPYYVIAKLA